MSDVYRLCKCFLHTMSMESTCRKEVYKLITVGVRDCENVSVTHVDKVDRAYTVQTNAIKSICSLRRFMMTSKPPLKEHWAPGHIEVMVACNVELTIKSLWSCFSMKNRSIWLQRETWVQSIVMSETDREVMYDGSLTTSKGSPSSWTSYLSLDGEGESS